MITRKIKKNFKKILKKELRKDVAKVVRIDLTQPEELRKNYYYIVAIWYKKDNKNMLGTFYISEIDIMNFEIAKEDFLNIIRSKIWNW